jgi:hypothetical protein
MIAPRIAVATSFAHLTPKPQWPLWSPTITNALKRVRCPARVCFWTGIIFITSSCMHFDIAQHTDAALRVALRVEFCKLTVYKSAVSRRLDFTQMMTARKLIPAACALSYGLRNSLLYEYQATPQMRSLSRRPTGKRRPWDLEHSVLATPHTKTNHARSGKQLIVRH